MTRKWLMVLSARQAERYATPKQDMATKLDRARERKLAKRQDEVWLASWAVAVKVRDGYMDRMTGRKVKGSRLALDPDAAHAHHVEPRGNYATRYDVRNGLCLSAATHDAIERNKITVTGTRWFKVGGQKFIDCTHRVTFKEAP